MPDRVIRDELLTSERYWRCSPEARCLYVSLLLSVDDAARYTGAPFALRTRCMAGTVSHERIDAILTELIDCDLVRRYEHNGKPYLFIPRFRNRRRYVSSSKYPAPPQGISDIPPEKSDSSPTQDSPKSDSSQTQDERGRRGVGVGVGEKQEQARTAAAVLLASAASKETPKVKTASKGTRLPTNWFLPDEWRDWAVRAYGIEPQKAVRISLDFRDFWWAKPGRDGVKLDWLATWRRWVRRELEHA